MQIKSALKFHLTPVRMGTTKKQKTTNAGNDVGKRKPYPLLPGIKTNRTIPETRVRGLNTKQTNNRNSNNRNSYNPAMPLLDICQKDSLSYPQRHLYRHVYYCS